MFEFLSRQERLKQLSLQSCFFDADFTELLMGFLEAEGPLESLVELHLRESLDFGSDDACSLFAKIIARAERLRVVDMRAQCNQKR